MKKFIGISLFALAALTPTGGHAQDAGLAIHVGTLGVGADIGTALSSRVGLRSGFNFFPLNIEGTVSDVDYQIDFASPTFTVMLDLYLAGPFRFTGGLVYSPNDFALRGRSTSNVDLNGTQYLASAVGTLTGTIVTNDLSPYLGLGLGNLARSRFGFFLDLGVAFHGTPGFTLTADGPASSLLQFQSDLTAEAQSIQDDLESITIYPVVTLGFSIGF